MIQDYDRPVKGYKTFEEYDHPATVLYDNFAPAKEEEVFVETAVEEPIAEEIISEEIPMEEVVSEDIIEEIVDEKEGEE